MNGHSASMWVNLEISKVNFKKTPNLVDRQLCHVTTRARMFCAVGLRDAVDVMEGGHDGLEVELRALRQVGRVAEIVEREQSRAAFDLEGIINLLNSALLFLIM